MITYREQWFDGLAVSQAAAEEFLPHHGALARKYVAANDNTALADPADANQATWAGLDPELAAETFAPLEKLPSAQVEALAKLPGFIYLGSPYAKYHAGLDEAARVVTECAGKLMARGIRIYCPIAHGHAVTRFQELPRTWDYWKDQDQPLINAASALIVLEMCGWWESVGLKYEFESFLLAGKPIIYLKPEDLGVMEPQTGRAT